MNLKTIAALAAAAFLSSLGGCTASDPGGCPTEFDTALHEVVGVVDVGLTCEHRVASGRLTFAVATEEQLAGALEQALRHLATTGLTDDWTLRVAYADQRGLMSFDASAVAGLPADPTLGLVRSQLAAAPG